MEASLNFRPSGVKLYLCSNPEDSVVERRALRERVFPSLREHCRCTGLDVRVIDPFESSDPSRWPDENTRKQLIAECRECSTGPYLLALIGHQYGTASLPAQVEVSDYQLLLQECQQVGVSTRELERAYQRDENTIPPSYCMRTLHSPSRCPQESVKIKAKEEEMKKVFQTGVSLCVHNGRMSPHRAHSYCRSVLDADLRFALDQHNGSDIAKRCLVYIHKVLNAKEREEEKTANPDLTLTPTHGQLFSELCDTFLPDLTTSCKLLAYTTTTECDRRHGYTTARRRVYAESLCLKVYSDLVALVNRATILESREELHDTLAREQSEQEGLCNILSRFYEVLRPEEEKVRAYVQQRDKQRPLVVTGGQCTGKTVLLAHCARQIKLWLPDSNPVVITHFCNLSTNTSTKHLLSTLCYQLVTKWHSKSFPRQGPSFAGDNICESSCSPTFVVPPFPSRHEPITRNKVSVCSHNLITTPCQDASGFNLGLIKPDISLSELKQSLSSLLTLLPYLPAQPLFLILDGLDQIEHNVGPTVIETFPTPLPPGVNLILTVSSNQTHVLQALELRYRQCSAPHHVLEGGDKEPGCAHVQLGLPDRKACLKMLASLLSRSGRTVTSGQQAAVNQALASCCLALYARLLREHTSMWHSDLDVTELLLPDGVHSSIAALLDHCEQKHGTLLVTRAVSYLTLSRTGLTEAELADLLSRGDQVLAECVHRGESISSSATVLQVDVERLLLDLKGFLIHRTVEGSDVLFWVSRHFKIVVNKKYLVARQWRKEIHSEMADYFSGRWTGGNAKPHFLNQKLETEKEGSEADMYTHRHLPSQPFVYASSSKGVGRVNLRKIVELPHHLQLSGRWEEMEHRLLMSLSFHEAMVRAGLLGDLVAMLEQDEGSSQLPFAREKLLLADILKSAACLLHRSPLQLPMVMETSLCPYLEVFPVLQGYVEEIRQERRRRGTGLGVAICPVPASVPSVQHVRSDAESDDVSVAEAAETECGTVVETMDDGSVWVWRSSERDLVKLLLSCEQKELAFVGVKSSGQFVLLSTGCNKLFLWDVSGPKVFLEVKTELKSGQETPKQTGGFVACQRKLFTWWKNESVVSMFDASGETLTHFQCQSCVTCLACSTDGFYLFCGQVEGTVSLFNTETGSLLGTCSNSNHSVVTLIVLCEDKGEMTCVDKRGNITVWDVGATNQPPRLVKEKFIEGKSDIISSVDHSEEKCVLLVCQPHQVTLWDTCDWEVWDQFLAPQEMSFAQALLSQDSNLLLASLDTLVLVWRVGTGECVLSLETNTQPHTLLKVASDVVCVGQDGRLTAWSSKTIDAVATAPKMGCGVREVLVEQAGQWFYTADGSEAVWRWDLNTGFPHESFLHHGPVGKTCLSMNDVHLVSLSAGEIYVWLTATGQNTLRIRAHMATDILIAPNCKFGVSVSERGLSRVWRLAHGSVVCGIPLYLCDAQVSPESTFLIGLRCGDLLAASLWCGSVSKRFSSAESSERVVAFHALAEHPDFVVVLGASGAVYTWNMVGETACRHFQLPRPFHCQPRDFQVSADGGYALLSADDDVINILDLHRVRLCSFKAEGPVIKACLGKSGGHAVYISSPDRRGQSCGCSLHAAPLLTVVRLTDGERVGSARLCGSAPARVVCEQRHVFVGFQSGSLGVYSVSDVAMSRDEPTGGRGVLTETQQCLFDRAPFSRLPLTTPNVAWT